MNLLLFLNELSLTPPAADVSTGRARMKEFLDTVFRTRQVVKSARPVVHMSDAIDSIVLAPDYSIASWRIDTATSRDEKLRLLQIATQAPILESGRAPEDIIERHLGMDCWYDGQLVRGLRGAIAADSLSVSFASAACWNAALLSAEVESLDEDDKITRKRIDIRHASTAGHVDAHESWLRGLERLSVRDGQDLWDRRGELFPALEFCKEVKGQLAEFLGGDIVLSSVIKRLVLLQKFFETWDGTPIGPNSLPTKCTPESAPTLAKYKDEHSFTPPIGPARVFSWHLRFTPGAGRLFFDGDAPRKKGIIGYIGKTKLPNVSYAT